MTVHNPLIAGVRHNTTCCTAHARQASCAQFRTPCCRLGVARTLFISAVLFTTLSFTTAGQVQAQDAAVEAQTQVLDATLQSVTQKPRWEFGVGGGYFSGFDYPASSDTNETAIALPFFIYRSDTVRVGDGGLRAVAIENPRLKLDLSVGGSLNASSDGDGVRQGMPDLDFLFELGPQLELRLLDRRLGTGERVRLRFTSDVRAVFSTDFGSIDSQGFVADVGLGLNVSNIADTGIALIARLGASFATEKLQDYFYQVDDEFVTDSRAAFDARAGYLETTLFTGLAIRPLPQLRIFAGVANGFFDGASNQQSPLFEVTQQTSFALGIVWTIKASEEMVEVVDLGGDNE